MNCFVSSMFLTGLAGPQQKAGIFICLVQNNGENIHAYPGGGKMWITVKFQALINHHQSVIYCCLRPASLLFYLPAAPRWNLPKSAEISQSHKYTRLYVSLFQFLVILAEFWSLFYTCNPIQTLTTAPCCLGFCADRRTLGTKDKCVSRK